MQGSYFIGPQKTPSAIKILIWITILAALLSPPLTYLCMKIFNTTGPTHWFALSLKGLKKGWLWQPLTYFFLESTTNAITLNLLFLLLFHMLILWFTGSEIQFRFGTKHFLFFYLGSGIFSGVLSALFLILFSNFTVLATVSPPLYALLFVFAMAYPDLEFRFLFLLHFKSKWIVAAIIGLSLLSALSQGQFLYCLAVVSALFFSWVFGHFVWKLKNPYIPRTSKPQNKNKGTIIDISSLKESDNDFMDRMLEKIGRYGEESLTREERERLEKISKRRR